ncbi:MAG: DUF2058 domain-containing protein [Phycisphaerales bacterium]|nr:hypothetical protein [Planctomycetota bacterium]MCH8508825.1 DUF2058 domain-containing protein [Phycisphaerales bacterium]
MPDELLHRVVVHGGVIPGVIALVTLALVWWRYSVKRTHPDAQVRPPAWALPLVITIGFVLADWVVKQKISWWPNSNVQRVPHAAGLIALVAIAGAFVRVPWPVRAVARALAFAGATWMLTQGYRPGVLSTGQLWALVAGAGLAGAVIATLADAGLARTRGWTGPAAALALVGLTQPFLHFAGFSSGSIALVGAIAALTSALLVALAFRQLTLGGGTATVLVGLVLISLLGAGVQSEPKSVPALLLIGVAPLALALRFRGPIPTLALRAGVIALLAGAAFGFLAMSGADEPDEDDPYADYFTLAS